MKPLDLPKIWSAPDHSQLTPKQISIRLPISISAKISALSDLYPRKTKNEIISDLLATALEQMEAGLPGGDDGKPVGVDPDGEPIFEASGVLLAYYNLTKKYLAFLESELNMQQATPPVEQIIKQKGKKNKTGK